MATRAALSPLSAEYPTTNFPQFIRINSRAALGFDATTAETCYWTLVAPQDITGAKTFVIHYMMASATTGGVAFDVAVEAVSSGDATDLDAGTSFATTNTGTDASVPGTAGYLETLSITLTNDDSVAAGDYIRVSVTRAVANASDTATGDCYVLLCEFRDAA